MSPGVGEKDAWERESTGRWETEVEVEKMVLAVRMVLLGRCL